MKKIRASGSHGELSVSKGKIMVVWLMRFSNKVLVQEK